MKIIAFAGRKQSGKTTCSYYIENLIFRDFQTSHSCKIYNFADPLKKDICMNILGLSYEQCYGEDSDKNTLTDIEWNGLKLTAREVMQFIGTDIFRKMKRDVWASATINKIQEIRSLERHGYVAVIADCRFPNEVEAVKNAGGYVIKLTRDPFHSDHSSEAALDPDNYYQDNFDLIIDNANLSIDEQNGYIHAFLKDKGILPL
jgi:hypothetical protein